MRVSHFALAFLLATAVGSTMYAQDSFWMPTDGPPGGVVVHAIRHPSGSYFLACGSGVYRSTDRGVTWTDRSNGLSGFPVTKLAADSGGTVYAAGEGGKVYQSTDQGSTWSDKSAGLIPTPVIDLQTGSDGTVFLALQHYTYCSTNGGATWLQPQFKSANDTILNSTGCNAIVQTPGSTVYAARGDGIFRLEIFGHTFRRVTDDTTIRKVSALALGTDGRLFAVLGNRRPQIFASGQSDSTWIAISEYHPNASVLCISSHGTFFTLGSAGLLLRSVDTGRTWTTIPEPKWIYTCASLDSNRLLLGTAYDVYMSDDDGHTSYQSGQGIAGMRLLGLAVNRFGTILTYGQSLDESFGPWTRAYYSTDRGATWQRAMYTTDEREIPRAVAASGSGAMFLGTNATLYVSRDSCRTWKRTSLTASIEYVSTGPSGHVFAVHGGIDLYRSTDDGESWTRVGTDVFRTRQYHRFVFGPNGTAWGAGDLGIYRSTDAGATWPFPPTGPLEAKFDRIAVSPEGIIYAGSSRTGKFLRTTDEGNSWMRVPGFQTDSWINDVLCLPNGQVIAIMGGGRAYRSWNNGQSWHGLDTAAHFILTALAADSTGYVYASTIGSSIVRSLRPSNVHIPATTENQSLMVRTIAPLPIQSHAIICYMANEEGSPHVELYDVLGRRAYAITSPWREAGEHTVRLDLSSVPPGIYIMHFCNGSKSYSRAIIVDR